MPISLCIKGNYMNQQLKFLINREIKNGKLLIKYFFDYGFELTAITLIDGLCRRFRLNNLYKKTTYKRHELCKNYLRKNYHDIVDRYKYINMGKTQISPDCIIWTLWWQGIDMAPYPVNYALMSMKKYAGQHRVCVIDKDNYKNYTSIPDYIIKKVENGIISLAAFSDILRTDLLYRHGGIWLDGTFLISHSFNEDIYRKEFYSVSFGGKREWAVSRDYWSVGLLACAKGNELMLFCRDMLFDYWKRENCVICYVLLDVIIAIQYDDNDYIKSYFKELPVNNLGVFDTLEDIRNMVVSDEQYAELMNRAYIHQVTYKRKYIEEINGNKTFFGRIVDGLIKKD